MFKSYIRIGKFMTANNNYVSLAFIAANTLTEENPGRNIYTTCWFIDYCIRNNFFFLMET